jgi:anhydro-N-acetylmuramic acid kinase
MAVQVIGLISGTSVDGIDAALVKVAGSTADLSLELIQAETYPYPEALRRQILRICAGEPLSMAELAALDDAVALAFAEAALQLQEGHPRSDLIGSHGQTVFHRPPETTPELELGYSLQLGRGAVIAQRTGITTVSNFRAADLAAQGQGAPLVPAVDACLLGHDSQTRCIQNLGGIGNVAYLPARSSTAPDSFLAWDTGPGNALLDLAVERLSGGRRQFDQDGAWAAQGTPCQALVQQWLQQPFFQLPPPKSTGRELFSPAYLDACWQDAATYSLSDVDFLATLTELTACSIVDSYARFLPQMPDQVAICGGGSRNTYLKQRIQVNLHQIAPNAGVCTTDDLGLNADFKEAIAFAVLAYWRSLGIPGNLPAATGARQAVPLGEIHPGSANW